MGDHLARGEEYERKAEKKLNSCGWWGYKFAKATNLFRQAAFRFKLAKSWDRAGSAYMEAAKCHLKCKNAYGAAKAYVCAANCYRKTSSKEAITCLEQAVNLFMDVGSLTSAATCYKDIGELYESEQNLEHAVDNFERAANLFKTEDVIPCVAECKQKVAQFAAQLEQYQKATEVYEEIASYNLNKNHLKFALQKCLLNAGLCQLSKVNIVAIENALARYQELDPTFSETCDCRFLKDITDAIDKVDAVKLTDTVKEFTNITPLDSWQATLLLRVKEKLEIMELQNGYHR